MSRSQYSDEIDNWALIKWRGQVASATRGRRGQALLKELLDALDAMLEKRLGMGALKDETGCLCTLGVIWERRGIEKKHIADPDVDPDYIASKLNIAGPLAQEIMFMNDEWGLYPETPEGRWQRMRNWVERQITEAEERRARIAAYKKAKELQDAP